MDIDLKLFFTTNNSSGWKCVSSKLKNKESAIFDHICLWSKINGFESLIFKEQVYLCINSHSCIPICEQCGKKVKYLNITLGYQSYCGVTCSNKNTNKIEVTRQAVILKYKVNSVNQLESVKNKRASTNLKLYGVVNSFEREDVKLKVKNRLTELYGTDHPMKVKSIKAKMNKSSLDKYGTDYPIGSDIIREKVAKTNMVKFNSKNVFSNETIKNKIKITNLKLYGYENPFDSLEIRNKIKKDKTSSIENKVCTSLNATPKFMFKNKEYDMILGDFIIEVNGEYWHQDKIEKLGLSQMNNIINDHTKIQALEGSNYTLLNVRPNALKGKKITLELIQGLSYHPEWFIDDQTVIMTKEYILKYRMKHGILKLKKQLYLFRKLLGIFFKGEYCDVKLQGVVGCLSIDLINDFTIQNIR